MGGPLRNTRVLISGASIAGPALAFWLDRYGFEVTVVEKAPELRRGGQAVDFKGTTHRTVLERMGILDEVRRARTPARGDGLIINAQGRRVATVPAGLYSGEIEVLRGDLGRILYDRTASVCEYVFGDSIASLAATADGTEVTFERSAPRTFDLVVGADGIHSNVRRLAFGPEAEYVRYLGYQYALAQLGGFDDGDLMYNELGRMVITRGSDFPAFFVFASAPLDDVRDDIGGQKRALVDAYRGGGWKLAQMMEQIPDAGEFYMDSISRVSMDHYARGPVVLLGDAAYGNTLGGFGTGLAIVGAYVLAGELHRAVGDYAVAFAQYQARIHDYAKSSRGVNSGKVLAPTTRLGLWARNRIFTFATPAKALFGLVDHFASDIRLEDYAKAA